MLELYLVIWESKEGFNFPVKSFRKQELYKMPQTRLHGRPREICTYEHKPGLGELSEQWLHPRERKTREIRESKIRPLVLHIWALPAMCTRLSWSGAPAWANPIYQSEIVTGQSSLVSPASVFLGCFSSIADGSSQKEGSLEVKKLTSQFTNVKNEEDRVGKAFVQSRTTNVRPEWTHVVQLLV